MLHSNVPRRLGRRGTVLVMLGLVWIVQGLAVGTSPRSTERGAQYLVHETLPTWLRVALWTGTGIVAVWAGFRQIPPGRDSYGFVALVILPIERGASFGWGFLLYLWHQLVEHVEWLPWDTAPMGYPRGAIGAVSWLTIAALLMVISGWADPRNRAVTHRGEQ